MSHATVRKSDAAAANLEKIWFDAARDYGVAHAQRVIVRLGVVFERLDRFPHMGREHPRLRAGVRYFPVKSYPFIVFFKHEPGGIGIVRILHERMLVEKHM